MQKTKHTPRPWKADSRYSPHSVHLVGADGRFVASSSWHDDSPHYPTKSEAFENFGMIAQAVNCHDDLLDAAKTVYEWMNGLPFPTTGCAAKMQILHDAIAKAEGRS